MISAGIKIGVAHVLYYLDYVENGGDPGRWLGQGAARLGLTGAVSTEHFRNLAEGRSPSGGPLLVRLDPDRVMGWDFTVSAPKSVSLLYALADDETAQAIRQAFDASVAVAAGVLEDEGGMVRVGHAGRDGHQRAELVVAGFTHKTSRALDPQLHEHLVVLNVGIGADGRWRSVDSRGLYAHKMMASAAFRAELRDRLSGLGYRWGKIDERGLAELAGFRPEVLEEFSTRSRQIAAYLADHGLERTAASAQHATLATRQTKVDVEFKELRTTWAKRAGALGLTSTTLDRLRGEGRSAVLSTQAIETMSAALMGPRGLTAWNATFCRSDVVREVVARLPEGAPWPVVRDLVGGVLARPEVVTLAGDGAQGLVGDLSADGSNRIDQVDATRARLRQTRYTTVEMLGIERDVLERARRVVAAGYGRVHDATLAAVLDVRGATLTGEQRAAVTALLTSGNGVEVLVGSPGSGKTYLLDVAREAWQAEGFSVVGGAIAAEAAKGLGDAAHMPSNTVAQMLIDIDRERREGDLVPQPGVVVIDEASMIGSRDLATLVDQLTGDGIKVVLVGDDRQLPAIAAGGLFGDLARQLGAIVLSDNGRQIERWEREAIAAGRMGRADEMVMAYVEHGRVVVAADRLTLAHRCVEDWWASRSSGADAVMLATSRADVTMLNRMARVHLEAGSELAGPVLSVPAHRRGPTVEREYQVGDQVRLCHNNRRLAGGVRNGMEGVVRSVDVRTMRITVATTDGRSVTLPPDYVRRWTDYAYASTDYKSEGKTVGTGSRALSSGSVPAERAVEGHAFVFDAGSRSAEAMAVAASRATTTTHFYALSAQPLTDEGHGRARPLDVELATERAWRRSAADVTAHEHLRQTDEVRRLAATCDRTVLAARHQVLVELIGSGIQGRRTLADARTAHAESVAVVDSLRATLTRVEEAPDSPAMVLQGVILRADLVRLEEGAVLATERVHVLEDFERRTAAARATYGDDVRLARERLAIVHDALAIQWQWKVDATLADPGDDLLAMLGPPPDDLAPLLRYREGISIIADARRHGIDGWRLDEYRESLLDGIRAGVGYDPVRQAGPRTAGTDDKVAAAAHEVESTAPTGWHYEYDAAGEPHSRYGSPETQVRFSVPPAASPISSTETLGLESEVLDLALSDLGSDGIELGI